jgi:hypothetical protein
MYWQGGTDGLSVLISTRYAVQATKLLLKNLMRRDNLPFLQRLVLVR